MATTIKRRKSYSLTLQLKAGSVDAPRGVLSGCTVAKAGVQAQGKLVFLDKAGKIVFDEELAVRKLPVFTDAKMLETLMSAAAAVGAKVKAREDHDDSIGARAGFFDAFKLEGDRVVADMHLFASYRNRDVVLETAANTPEEIGLSIDFIPEFEILADRALMRCKKLIAVDIVDEGAITPGGLFLSAGVDSDENLQTAPAEPENKTTMPPTIEELSSQVSQLAKTVGECVAAMSKLSTPPAAPKEITEGLAAIRAEQEKLSLSVKEQGEKLVTITADNVRLKKTASVLGVRVLPNAADRVTLANGSAEEIEKIGAGTGEKSYDDLVTERVASEKCKRSDAHLFVMKAHPEAYRTHLKAKGIYDPAKAKANA